MDRVERQAAQKQDRLESGRQGGWGEGWLVCTAWGAAVGSWGAIPVCAGMAPPMLCCVLPRLTANPGSLAAACLLPPAELNVAKSNLIKESIRMAHNELGDLHYAQGDLQAGLLLHGWFYVAPLLCLGWVATRGMLAAADRPFSARPCCSCSSRAGALP